MSDQIENQEHEDSAPKAKPGRPRKTAKLVWLGNESTDKATVWNAIKFLRGVPTEVSDPVMIRKAKGNPYYEVVE